MKLVWPAALLASVACTGSSAASLIGENAALAGALCEAVAATCSVSKHLCGLFLKGGGALDTPALTKESVEELKETLESSGLDQVEKCAWALAAARAEKNPVVLKKLEMGGRARQWSHWRPQQSWSWCTVGHRRILEWLETKGELNFLLRFITGRDEWERYGVPLLDHLRATSGLVKLDDKDMEFLLSKRLVGLRGMFGAHLFGWEYLWPFLKRAIKGDQDLENCLGWAMLKWLLGKQFATARPKDRLIYVVGNEPKVTADVVQAAEAIAIGGQSISEAAIAEKVLEKMMGLVAERPKVLQKVLWQTLRSQEASVGNEQYFAQFAGLLVAKNKGVAVLKLLVEERLRPTTTKSALNFTPVVALAVATGSEEVIERAQEAEDAEEDAIQDTKEGLYIYCKYLIDMGTIAKQDCNAWAETMGFGAVSDAKVIQLDEIREKLPSVKNWMEDNRRWAPMLEVAIRRSKLPQEDLCEVLEMPMPLPLLFAEVGTVGEIPQDFSLKHVENTMRTKQSRLKDIQAFQASMARLLRFAGLDWEWSRMQGAFEGGLDAARLVKCLKFTQSTWPEHCLLPMHKFSITMVARYKVALMAIRRVGLALYGNFGVQDELVDGEDCVANEIVRRLEYIVQTPRVDHVDCPALMRKFLEEVDGKWRQPKELWGALSRWAGRLGQGGYLDVKQKPELELDLPPASSVSVGHSCAEYKVVSDVLPSMGDDGGQMGTGEQDETQGSRVDEVTRGMAGLGLGATEQNGQDGVGE